MGLLPAPLDSLTTELARWPGVGPKSAQRMAFHVMTTSKERVARLVQALEDVSEKLGTCTKCFFIAEGKLCAVCANPRRDPTHVCVVQDALDVLAIERSGEFRGLYHVLGGAISPMDGIGPAELHIAQLLRRVGDDQIVDVTLAMDSNVEGEATAHYLASELRALGVSVFRLAHGLPAGADIQYADEVTVSRAFTGRRPL